jgi:hypothetical protein
MDSRAGLSRGSPLRVVAVVVILGFFFLEGAYF